MPKKSFLDDPRHEEHPLDEIVWRAEQQRTIEEARRTGATVRTARGTNRRKLADRKLPVSEHPLDPQ